MSLGLARWDSEADSSKHRRTDLLMVKLMKQAIALALYRLWGMLPMTTEVIFVTFEKFPGAGQRL